MKCITLTFKSYIPDDLAERLSKLSKDNICENIKPFKIEFQNKDTYRTFTPVFMITGIEIQGQKPILNADSQCFSCKSKSDKVYCHTGLKMRANCKNCQYYKK